VIGNVSISLRPPHGRLFVVPRSRTVLAMRLRTWLATLLLFLFAAPAFAQASGTGVIKDCTDDGVLSRNYSQRDYTQALADLPTDVDEYTDCRDLIRRAQLGAAGGGGNSGTGNGGGTAGGGGTGTGGGTGGGGGGPAAATAAPGTDPLQNATPRERAAFHKAVRAGAVPVKLDGRPVSPGSLGSSSVTGLSDLPTPLLIVLALLAAGGLGALGLGGRRLVHARRSP
jgi:hypothetical protein